MDVLVANEPAQQQRIHGDRTPSSASASESMKHPPRKDFSNSTFEEVLASLSQPVRSQHRTRKSTRTLQSGLPSNQTHGTPFSRVGDRTDEMASSEDSIHIVAVTTRWNRAEQRFLELFFGQDLVLRSRQRHQHILEALIQRQKTLPRSKSASKTVKFNLTRNLQYEFSPLPVAARAADQTSFHRSQPSQSFSTQSQPQLSPEDDRESQQTNRPDGDNDDDFESLSRLNCLLLTDDRTKINTSRKVTRGDGIRIVRPRTAELSADLQERLKRFRELDAIAFLKPETRANGIQSVPNSRSRTHTHANNASRAHTGRQYACDDSNTDGSYSSVAPGVHGVRRMSTAARLLLARSGASSTSSTSSFSSKSATSHNAQTAASSARTNRSLDSAQTFNPPSSNQVVSFNNSYAVPKHKRPLSKGVRRFIVDAVVQDSVHPKLGAKASSSTDRKITFQEREQPEQSREKKGDNTRGRRAIKSLHYHLHPPGLPEPGLSLHPYDIQAMHPPTQVLTLQVPVALKNSLQDPRNLVGLEGERRGGRLLMRKIRSLYTVPKCPRVGGRITPVGSRENICEIDIGSDSESGGDEDFNVSDAGHDDTEPDYCSKLGDTGDADCNPNSPDKVIQQMVFANQDQQDLQVIERHRVTQQDVKQSFSKMVGSLFPLDYFMNQDELYWLVSQVDAWKMGCLDTKIRAWGLVQTSAPQTQRKIHTTSEIWHGGFLVDYNSETIQFLIEWDTPYPQRIPTNFFNTPDPSPNTRWLNKAELRMDHESAEYHLKKLCKANEIRVEFESRLTMTQICGIVAPVLTPVLPEFPIRTVDLVYEQIQLWQAMQMNRRESCTEKFPEEKIPRVQTAFIADTLNSLRDMYFLSQIEASIKLNPRLEALFAPSHIKKTLGTKLHISHSTCPEKFHKTLTRMRTMAFLVFKPAVQKVREWMLLEMKLGTPISFVLEQISTGKLQISRPTRAVESPPATATLSSPAKSPPIAEASPQPPGSRNKMYKAARKMARTVNVFAMLRSPPKPVELTVDNLHALNIGHVWSDMFMYREDEFSMKRPMFDDSRLHAGIQTVFRKSMPSLKLIAYEDFKLLLDHILSTIQPGITTTLPAIAQTEFSKSIKQCRTIKTHHTLSPMQFNLICASSMQSLLKWRFMDILRTLRDGGITVAMDTRLFIKMKKCESLGKVRPGPFVDTVEIVADPSPETVQQVVTSAFGTLIEDGSFALVPGEDVALSNAAAATTLNTIKNPTSRPLEHGALAMMAQELVSDTYESTRALLRDRVTLVQEWIREFEGATTVVEESLMETVRLFETVPLSLSNADARLSAFNTCVIDTFSKLTLIETRAKYTFTSTVEAATDGFKMNAKQAAAASVKGFCDLEVRGFVAVRCQLLHVGVVMWAGRWRDWLDHLCQVMVEQLCEILGTSCVLLEEAREVLWVERARLDEAVRVEEELEAMRVAEELAILRAAQEMEAQRVAAEELEALREAEANAALRAAEKLEALRLAEELEKVRVAEEEMEAAKMLEPDESLLVEQERVDTIAPEVEPSLNGVENMEVLASINMNDGMSIQPAPSIQNLSRASLVSVAEESLSTPAEEPNPSQLAETSTDETENIVALPLTDLPSVESLPEPSRPSSFNSQDSALDGESLPMDVQQENFIEYVDRALSSGQPSRASSPSFSGIGEDAETNPTRATTPAETDIEMDSSNSEMRHSLEGGQVDDECSSVALDMSVSKELYGVVQDIRVQDLEADCVVSLLPEVTPQEVEILSMDPAAVSEKATGETETEPPTTPQQQQQQQELNPTHEHDTCLHRPLIYQQVATLLEAVDTFEERVLDAFFISVRDESVQQRWIVNRIKCVALMKEEI
ncbi:hypothetical protein BJ741DRAFT_612972 [Chytriomyces cf. hyalinus JEL632]|nr:hypothetical protein BJ741DRAFT_612972 [Chytriomyces cf. hyalinus JEL632]